MAVWFPLVENETGAFVIVELGLLRIWRTPAAAEEIIDTVNEDENLKLLYKLIT